MIWSMWDSDKSLEKGLAALEAILNERGAGGASNVADTLQKARTALEAKQYVDSARLYGQVMGNQHTDESTRSAVLSEVSVCCSITAVMLWSPVICFF